MTACFAANKIQLRYVAVKMNMRHYNRDGEGGGEGGEYKAGRESDRITPEEHKKCSGCINRILQYPVIPFLYVLHQQTSFLLPVAADYKYCRQVFSRLASTWC